MNTHEIITLVIVFVNYWLFYNIGFNDGRLHESKRQRERRY